MSQEIDKLRKVEIPSNEEVTNEVSSLLEITDTINLDKEVERQPSIFKHLQNTLSKHSRIFDDVEYNYNVVYTWLYRYYDGRLNSSVYANKPLPFTPSTKTELERMIKIDPFFEKVNKDMKIAEANLKIIEDSIWQLRQRPKNIQTIVEWRKYVESGM